MRKMKKFLAVTLSAAMVLSVSVPAMAAGEEATTIVRQDPELVAAYEQALKDEAAAKEKYDDLAAELIAAQATREALGDEAVETKEALNKELDKKKEALGVAKDATEKVTKKAADDEVATMKTAKGEADDAVEEAQKEIATMKTELPDLLDAKNGADKAVSDLEAEIKALEAELKADPAPSPDRQLEIDAKLKEDRAALGKEGDKDNSTAYGRKYLAKKAYDDQVAKIGEQTKALNEELIPAQEAADRAYVDQKAERDTVYGLYRAINNADVSAASLDEIIKDLQHQVVEAQKELSAATAKRQAAEARLDEEGKAYTEKVYNEKLIRAELAKEIVDKVQAELDEAENALAALEEKIAGYVADYTTNYNNAVEAEKKATKEAADALKELDDATADLKTKTDEYETALDNVNLTIPFEIHDAMVDLQLAMSDEDLNSPNYEVVEEARDEIARLQQLVDDYETKTVAAGDEALVNATARVRIALQRFQTAEANWTEKALAKTAAMDALNTAEAKRKAAYEKLVTMYKFDGNEYGAKLVKDADGKVTKEVLDQETGEYRYTSDGKYECNTAKTATTDLYYQWNKAKQAVDSKKAELVVVTKQYNDALDELEDAITAFEYTHGYKPGEPSPEEQKAEEEQKKAEEAEKAAQEAIIAKFSDVNAGDWFVPFVTHVYNKGIMTGMSDSFFGASNTLQRQDFTVMLYRMYLKAGGTKYTGKSNFKDVDQKAYYAEAVAWASNAGVVKGYADTGYTVFGVGDDITREDFAVMLYRFYKFAGEKADISSFLDASKVAGYAVDAIQWAVAAGAITGKNDGTKIDPQAPIARCEAAKMIDIVTDAFA